MDNWSPFDTDTAATSSTGFTREPHHAAFGATLNDLSINENGSDGHFPMDPNLLQLDSLDPVLAVGAHQFNTAPNCQDGATNLSGMPQLEDHWTVQSANSTGNTAYQQIDGLAYAATPWTSAPFETGQYALPPRPHQPHGLMVTQDPQAYFCSNDFTAVYSGGAYATADAP